MDYHPQKLLTDDIPESSYVEKIEVNINSFVLYSIVSSSPSASPLTSLSASVSPSASAID
jgi:hypothetical protein